MISAHGGKALLVAASTAVAGADHSIVVAVITALGGVTAVVVGPLVTDRIRHRTIVDHAAEAQAEHADLSQQLLDRLVARDAEITQLRIELDKARHRRG